MNNLHISVQGLNLPKTKGNLELELKQSNFPRVFFIELHMHKNLFSSNIICTSVLIFLRGPHSFFISKVFEFGRIFNHATTNVFEFSDTTCAHCLQYIFGCESIHYFPGKAFFRKNMSVIIVLFSYLVRLSQFFIQNFIINKHLDNCNTTETR